MRLSRLLGKTLRHPPSDAHLISHQLLVRAGYARVQDAGQFAYLPLGRRTLSRLEHLLQTEMARLGAQEVQMPTPADRPKTAEVVRLVRREIDSYRQLPILLFQTTPQVMPPVGGRTGLFGARERPFFDIYAFSTADLSTVPTVAPAIERLLSACALETVWAEAGDEGQRAYIVHPAGDAELVRCPACGYTAERAWARTHWPEAPDEPERPTEQIATPGCDTIASLAEFLDIPASRTLKMVFYSVLGKVTCLVLRGDRAVDEDKLARLLGTRSYYASVEDELASIGAVGGYASPIGLDQRKVRVVADPSARSGKNFVSGANQPDYHILNVNIPRDFAPGSWVDLALIEAGDACPECRAGLDVEPAFALIHQTLYAPCQPEAAYQDEQGNDQALWMADWHIDLGRLMAAVVEQHHDDYGPIWPVACTPFDVHLLALDLRQEAVVAQAEALYRKLVDQGFSVLYDDRDGSAGVKFNDADLIGIPLRLTLSKRSVKEGVIEAKWRDSRERMKLDDAGLAEQLSRIDGTPP